MLRPMLVLVALLNLLFWIQPIQAFVYHHLGDFSHGPVFSIGSEDAPPPRSNDSPVLQKPVLGRSKVRLELYDTPADNDDEERNCTHRTVPSQLELELMQRILQLEQLAASQQVQIRHLTGQVKGLTDNMSAFDQVIELLREAGRTVQGEQRQQRSAQENNNAGMGAESSSSATSSKNRPKDSPTVMDPLETEGLFSSAPSSVMDAADAAGAAVLAGLLAGKQRMLVDVRDAELTFDPENSETLVQFIELAILPVAAGLEGLRSQRNRLKIVFPTVSHLLMYRRSMALAAPEVVALSTLGFDPVEKKDNLVVIVVPSPDDEEGLGAMNELLRNKSLTQPVVVINHHMLPVSGPASGFDVAYHLRLLSVQYMTGENSQEFFQQSQKPFGDGSNVSEKLRDKADVPAELDSSMLPEDEAGVETTTANASSSDDVSTDSISFMTNDMDCDDIQGDVSNNSSRPLDTNSGSTTSSEAPVDSKVRDDALEAAVKHAQEIGLNRGTTRAMVIRAYPQPWHVFVDTSPDTDADFEVAALFDEEPTSDEVNLAIVECLEGSEHEDELVAQEMQKAFELGQLDRVSEMLSKMGIEDIDDEEDDMSGEDTV